MSDLLEGVQLSDFLLIECISRGGVADVYRGRQIGEGNYEVAVKVFRPGYAQRESFRDYFMAEAEKIGQFEHPNILPFLEFGEGEGLLYTVTPFIASGTLDDLLQQVGGKFSAMQALPIMQQLCNAIQYAHDRDVIHGNIKPSNVFVAADGRMLLADFGIVRGYDDSQQSLTRVGWGSAEYAAPEQSLGVLRRASDVYALGVLLFRIITGTPPFTGKTPVEVLLKHVRQQAPPARSIDAGISDAVDEVVQMAMRKRSDDRFASAEEMRSALVAAVTFSPVASPVARSVPAFTRPLTKSGVFAARDPYTPAPVTVTMTTPPVDIPELPVQAASSASDAAPLQPVFPAVDQDATMPGIGKKHFLQNDDDDDTDTKLFWSADPVEWSPIGNEQTASVPLTATDYLRSKPDAPHESDETVGTSDSAQVAPAETKLPEPLVEAREPQKDGGKQKKSWQKKALPILVVILLLIGLAGALLSSFLFPGLSTKPATAPQSSPGVTATVGTTATVAATPTGQSKLTPTPTQSKATATAVPQPTLSPTPVPIPANPAIPAFSCATGSVSMDGSSNFIPAVQQLTTDYNSQCASNVNFSFNADDSLSGLNALQSGSVDLAYSDLPSSGRAGLVDYQVAALMFAVVVNSDTQVTKLTTAQLQAIYSGRITNWSQVGGSNESIVILSQPQGSTVRTIFETFVLHGAQTVSGNATQTGVQNVTGGITYMPLASVPGSGAGAQSVAINGVAPGASSAASGAYPFWTIEHLYSRNAAQGVALSFISFCMTNLGASDLASSGAVPYKNMSTLALRSHIPGPTI
ncbi:MAG TPA: serine/threonine-protein kinase [Ktedonobacteraceae bacterium]|nr:serine/threonine-protein kinase [Ktedonobacteraceae bacterium]